MSLDVQAGDAVDLSTNVTIAWVVLRLGALLQSHQHGSRCSWEPAGKRGACGEAADFYR